MKILGIMMVLFSSGAMGFYFTLMNKNRIKELRELKKCMVILRGDIAYAGTTLPEAVTNLSHKTDCILAEFFSVVSRKLSGEVAMPFFAIWSETIEEQLGESALKKEDKNQLREAGRTMGSLDKVMQTDAINLYIEQLDMVLGEEQENLKEKSRLYNTLGIMFGVLIVLVLI